MSSLDIVICSPCYKKAIYMEMVLPTLPKDWVFLKVWMLDYAYGFAADLLELVPWDDLRSLTRTVCDGLIVPENKDEAIKVILQHSKDPEELLSRQKVTKEVLFMYLHKKNVTCPQRDKQTLKKMIIDLWSNDSSDTLSPKMLCQRTVTSGEELATRSNTEVSATSSIDSTCDSVVLEPNSVITVDVNELAVKFAEWFYSLLNQTVPLKEGSHIIGPEHFFQDCSLHMKLESRSGCINSDVEHDASGVASLLVKTKAEHNLHFNPNITANGTRGKMDRHGLVLVAVCGTLHQGQNCAGVFDQLFGLARDPFADNNWKIKYTELNLKSQELINGTPSLENSITGQRVLALPDIQT